MHKIEEIKSMKCRLMKLADIALDNAEQIDTKELGEVVDMIKDLSEAEEKCIKAKYYEALTCAMETAEGVVEGMDPEDVEMMYADLMQNGPRGYNSHHSARTGRFVSNAGSHRGGMRGYHPEDGMMMDRYDPESKDMPTERFGRPYNEYRAMRRNYTESRSREDKAAMERYAKEHLDDTQATLKDIWNGADPDLRKKMKSDLTSLLATMN